jgi:hypothetical protein
MNRHLPNHIERALPATVAMFATACMTVMSASPASAVERIAVTEIKPLLMWAAERGEAHGVLTGTGAAYLQRRFDTASPIEVDVRRLRTLSQSGCGRLEVTTRQRAVLVNGNRADQELAYELNFCADGRFPGKR